MSRYSSARQEKHFQPCRIVIAERRRSWVAGYGFAYHVIIRDMTTLRPVEEYYEGKWVEWQSLPGLSYKKDAYEIAKRQAVERDLPFTLGDDPVSYEELDKGPYRPCVACGHATQKRSYEPFICPSCLAALKIGREAKAKRGLYGIYPYNLVPDAPYYTGRADELFNITMALLKLMQVQVESTDHNATAEPVVACFGKRTRVIRESKMWSVMLTDAQAQAMRDFITALTQFGNDEFVSGKRDGSSLLKRLARGTVHPQDFSDARGR